MSLNLNSKTSYCQFDEFGMCLVPSDQSWTKRKLWQKLWDWIIRRDWIPSWLNKSKRDSLGRTILCGLAYGFTSEMIEGIELCYCNGILYRHPELDEVASRDHHSYFYIYRKWTNQELPAFPRMRGMNLWMKALTGNKRAEWWYYFWAIPGAYLGNAWLRFCRKAGKIRPELHHMDWLHNTYTNGEYIQHNRTPWQKLWGWIILNTIPAFSLHIKAWQIYVMQKTPKRDALCKILIKRVGKSNIMLRLLLGDIRKERNIFDDDGELLGQVVENYHGVTQEEVDSYPHMTGYRPGVYLDESCRRDIRELTEEEAEWNTYEKDLIQYLHNDLNGCNSGSGA